MVSAALQEAMDTLLILDVYLEGMNCTLETDFEPKYDANAESLIIEFKHLVRKSNIVEINGNEKILRVYIDLGIRWMSEDSEEAEGDEKAKMEASFIAEYSMPKELKEESIKEFSLQNASYHVWPYWRELVASHSERMRLPRVTMPTVQLAANGLNKGDDVEDVNK